MPKARRVLRHARITVEELGEEAAESYRNRRCGGALDTGRDRLQRGFLGYRKQREPQYGKRRRQQRRRRVRVELHLRAMAAVIRTQRRLFRIDGGVRKRPRAVMRAIASRDARHLTRARIRRRRKLREQQRDEHEPGNFSA